MKKNIIKFLCCISFVLSLVAIFYFTILYKKNDESPAICIPESQLDFENLQLSHNKNLMVLELGKKLGKEIIYLAFEIPSPLQEKQVIQLDRHIRCLGGVMTFKQDHPLFAKYIEGKIIIEKMNSDYITIQYYIRLELIRLFERRFFNMPYIQIKGFAQLKKEKKDSVQLKWKREYQTIKQIVSQDIYDKIIKNHEPFPALYK